MMNRCFIFLLGSLFIISACSKDKSDNNNQPYASVSIYAMVPDAPQLNLFLNGNNIAASVPFGSFTLYNHIPPGITALKAQTASQNTSIDTSFSISADKYYSLFLTGSLADIKPVVIEDVLAKVDSGYINLRFFVLSPGVSNIDFHIVKDSTITKDSTTKDSIIDKVPWRNRSFSDDIANDSINVFTRFAKETYSFYAIKANSTDTLARFKNKVFSSSANYTLLLEGLYNKNAADTILLLGTRLHQ